MCNAYCCCRETTTSGLINLLFVFAFINLLLSVSQYLFVRRKPKDMIKLYYIWKQ